jgi:hypothetical protein
MKNFPPADELRQALGAVGREVQVLELPHYWLAWGKFGMETAVASLA